MNLNKRRFARMYNAYADDIFRYVLVNVKNKQQAEDITSETFAKAWASIDKFNFKQPRPWLYKIAKNLIIDSWRKKQPLEFEYEELPSDDQSLEEKTDSKIQNEVLLSTIAKLPEEMRSVITLRFLSGYSVNKTAESLGLSDGNVRVIQYRALKKLRGMMK